LEHGTCCTSLDLISLAFSFRESRISHANDGVKYHLLPARKRSATGRSASGPQKTTVQEPAPETTARGERPGVHRLLLVGAPGNSKLTQSHMAGDNKLELVIDVQADKANPQIKGPTQSLAGIERIAVSVAKSASEGIDGMTASMAKGGLAGNLLPPLHAKSAWRGPRCWLRRSRARPSRSRSTWRAPSRWRRTPRGSRDCGLRISDFGFEAVQPGPGDARPEGKNRLKASGILNPAWSAPLWDPHPERNRRNQGFS